jgi:hypothetical protein
VYLVVVDLFFLAMLAVDGFAVFLLKQKLPFSLFSPVWIFTSVFFAVIFSGLFVYESTDWSFGILHDLGSLVSSEELRVAAVKIGWIVFAFLCGAGVYTLTQPASAGKVVSRQILVQRLAGRLDRPMSDRRSLITLAVSAIALMFLVAGVGPLNLIERSLYLPVVSQPVKSMGLMFTPIASLGLGTLFIRGSRWSWRMAALLINLLALIIFFALASRSGAATAMLFAVGILMGRRDSRGAMALAAVWVVLAGILLVLALALRGFPTQGVTPFVNILMVEGLDVLVHHSGTGIGMVALVGSFPMSLPLTAVVMLAQSLTPADLVASISPLPGVMSGWYQIVDRLRVTPYAPYNAVGELLNYGLSIALPYFFVVGAFFAKLDYRVRSSLNREQWITAAGVFGLTLMFSLTAIQYNLRSATRVIYYLLVIEAFLLVLPSLRSAIRKPQGGRAQ